MRVIRDLNAIEEPLRNPVLTIGNFDGVHRGHLALFAKVKERAGTIGGQSVVMTFEPHPIRVMKPGNGPPLLTPTKQKVELIGRAGIDVLFCIPFTREFSSVSARDFVKTVLVDKIGVKEIVVGYDYAFGRNREGNIPLLREMGEEAGFLVHLVEPIQIEDTLVSSTSIRKLINEGKLSDAKRLLGRDYQVEGTVVKGRDRGGRLLGYPTANLKIEDGLLPKTGVYAVTVIIEDQQYDGVTNVGFNPTFGDNVLSVETHVLDYSGDLVDKPIRINFLSRLRDEKTFRHVQELVDEIGKDIEKARTVFAASR